MDVACFSRSARFPAVAIKSYAEFQSYLDGHQSSLHVRRSFELSLATNDHYVTTKGTCAPCLRPSTFLSLTKDGERMADGRTIPNWRQQMRCDCQDQLTGRQRALLHFLQATVLAPWTRLLLFGPSSNVHQRLSTQVDQVNVVPSFQRSSQPKHGHPTWQIDAPGSSFDAVISEDYLALIPSFKIALSEILRVLVPGGRFVFTIPFRSTSTKSEYIDEGVSPSESEFPVEFPGRSHIFGWDLLSLLCQLGFRDAAAYFYWSEELGYLGATNFLFKAVK